MADYRTVWTEMWRADDWFQTLPLDARLFWVYLFTNPSASVSGIYKLPLRTMAFESGISQERVTELLNEFEQAGKAFYQDGIVWVRKMRDYQLPGKLSSKLVTHLSREIAKIPYGDLKHRYLQTYGYRIDTVSIPVTEKETNSEYPIYTSRTDTDTDTDTDTPIPHVAGNGSGRAYSEKMKSLNNKLGPELRRTLADALLKITGQLDLANTETDAGTSALYAAHEAAVAVYQMGYKSAEDLMAPEDEWYASDFRGKQGDRPSLKWLLEQCAKTKAGKRDTSPKPVEVWQ